jgi:hypothetical protein
MTNIKFFNCANKNCHIITQQPIERCRQELSGCYLCEDCYNKGLRLEYEVIIRSVSNGSGEARERFKHIKMKIRIRGNNPPCI